MSNTSFNHPSYCRSMFVTDQESFDPTKHDKNAQAALSCQQTPRSGTGGTTKPQAAMGHTSRLATTPMLRTPHLVLSADKMFSPEPKTRIFCSTPRRATESKIRTINGEYLLPSPAFSGLLRQPTVEPADANPGESAGQHPCHLLVDAFVFLQDDFDELGHDTPLL